jgi:hypothetical protein
MEEYNMEKHKQLEKTNLLTVSTAHITAKTAHMLEKEPTENAMCLCVYDKVGYGWYIAITENMDTSCVPKDLAKLISLAIDLDCSTLCLDCDCEPCNYLDTYEW